MERNSSRQASAFSLPLVSIIIINYNYGRFLQETLSSVLAQSYPHIECIIVDDCSTDNSGEILQHIAEHHPNVCILRRTCNGGQSLATQEGFEASTGEYVVFLDADDFLLPRFVETHVFIHLSLRIPVGVTSSNMLQSMGSRIVLGSLYPMNRLVLKQKNTANLLQRIDHNAPDFWPFPSPDEALEEQIYYYHPKRLTDDWYWSPTSGNCFRRDALHYFLNNEQLNRLHYSTDAYLLRGVSFLTGSVIINRSLAVYRMHGSNAFSNHPHLYGVLNFEKGGFGDYNPLSNQLIKRHLAQNAKVFLRKIDLPNKRTFVHLLKFRVNLFKGLKNILFGSS